MYDDTLQLGVCAVIVLDADISVDSGEWTCNVGVLGSVTEDNAITITVGVSGIIVNFSYHG
jgi:selenophosphate synthetase-related protein